MNPGQFKEGAKAATPIILGFVPVGMAFGVLAQKAGMTPWEAGLMSLLVYAGSSQFIAVEMLSGGGGVASDHPDNLFRQSPSSVDEFPPLSPFQAVLSWDTQSPLCPADR